MKKCARCGIDKPVEDFYRDVRFTDGRPRGACKACMSQARPKEVVVPERKQCSKCGVAKPASEFLRDGRHADGLRAECAECFYTKTRYFKTLDWRHNNPERVREYNIRQRRSRLRYQARWTRENPEAATEKHRHAKQRQRAKDPVGFRSKIQAATNRRRALKRNNGPHTFTRHEWEAVKTAYEHSCAYCGITPLRLSIDHVLPLALGGVHSAWNIVPACLKCNIRKGARIIVIPDYSRHPYV